MKPYAVIYYGHEHGRAVPIDCTDKGEDEDGN
jgi:hypothetical protein